MEINIGISECHKNVDNYYGSNITVWIPRCAGREAFDSVEPLPKYCRNDQNCSFTTITAFAYKCGQKISTSV